MLREDVSEYAKRSMDVEGLRWMYKCGKKHITAILMGPFFKPHDPLLQCFGRTQTMQLLFSNDSCFNFVLLDM